MREIIGNLWDYHEQGHWICITTNGTVKRNGQAVMGAGCAKEARQRYPRLPIMLGKALQKYGNHVFAWEKLKIITFPVKHQWFEMADIELIKRSCKELIFVLDKLGIEIVFLPRPGCGNGKLDWGDVKQEIAPLLDDRVYVISLEE